MTEPTAVKPTQGHWSNVDDTDNAATYASYLDTVRAMDSATAYKRRAMQLMKLPLDGHGLEIGCGLGDDARELAATLAVNGGRMIAVDNSAAMIAEAQRRSAGLNLPVDFRVGDVHALDFPDHTFHATRADRVFQHLSDPVQSLREMIRVTKPGGWIVITDPDWGTYTIDLPDTQTAQAFLHHAQRQARNYWIGRQLYGLYHREGLEDISVAGDTLFFLDYAVFERLGNIDAGLDAACAAGQLTSGGAEELRAAMRSAAREGRFFASTTVFTVCGRKPAA